MSYQRLQEIGREFDQAHPGYYDEAIAAGSPEDTAIILYRPAPPASPRACATRTAA